MLVLKKFAHLTKPLSMVVHSIPKCLASFSYVLNSAFFATTVDSR